MVTENLTAETFSRRNGESVTDNKSVSSDPRISRNEEPSVDGFVAMTKQMLEAMDPRTEGQRRAAKLQLKSVENAALCFKCERAIGPTEAVYRLRVASRGFMGWGRIVAVAYGDCGALFSFRRFFPFRPCEHCKRQVRVEATAHRLLYVVCSKQCGKASEIRRASERRQHEAARKSAACATCKQSFTPKRADMKHCSPACKQKCYRDKIRLNARKAQTAIFGKRPRG